MTEAVPADALAARLDGGERPYLLDVRSADDFAEWHIDGAENVPLIDELAAREFDGLADAMDDLPADREIVTVCVAGVTSRYAAEFLREHGYDARSLDGGMRAWGQVYRAHDTPAQGVTQFVRPGTGCVSYLVTDGGNSSGGPDGGSEALIVDPGMHVDVYADALDDRGLDLAGVVDTHSHADHVSGGRRLAAEYGVPYHLHEADAGSLSADAYAAPGDGDELPVGDRTVEVLHTPGHTPGSVSLLVDGALLSGDTLFVRGVGRPDLEDGSEAAVREAAGDLFDSIGRLLELPDDTPVLPGHFSDESARPVATTVGDVDGGHDLAAVDDRAAFVERVVDGLAETPANYERIKRINRGEEPVSDDVAALELGPNNCAAN